MTAWTTSLWASLPVPAIILDPEDRIGDVNPAAESFLNASRKSLEGHPVWDKVFVDAPLEEAFARVRSGQAPLFVNTVDVGTGSKKPVVCDVQIAPLADRPDHVLVLLESRELAGRLDRAMSSKTAAKSAIGMAEMLAHEIKNPLAGITGAAQLISMHASGEDRELTDLIVEETRRILKLVDQVEEFGNLRPPDRRAVNIHDVLDRARKSAMVGFAAHMTIEDDYDPSLPLTWADPDQLLQVFLNLLKNAAEACKSGGTLRLRSFYELSLKVRRRDGTGGAVPLQIEIIDDGPGLPDAIAADIFDPFVSGRENGTGLGLALVSKIIADHDGWIAVDSVPGRTVFRISLPVAPKDGAP
ncbi:two-component system sensor histidine kinase NtrB [Rhodophyticola porphyridii]|uniref:histidine kinase n=1 Tax=Rhodophyticola porphyridii TaxID=1852017 RepID=A0A3L9XYT0_9RHOB|nr:ATP-binding protein [Rhodophyticola porphyridii]RMA41392.1 PAS domain-containing sensor histidine kinase [Rhodophyticola porphyridii]